MMILAGATVLTDSYMDDTQKFVVKTQYQHVHMHNNTTLIVFQNQCSSDNLSKGWRNVL